MRRRLLLAAAGAAALTSTSIPAQPSSPDVWDVVIVGSGAAGLASAVSAVQNGASKVLVLEKAAMIGGHTILSTGYMTAVVSSGLKELQYREAVADMAADMIRVGEGRNNAALVQKLCEESGAAVQWLESLGLVWVPHAFQTLAGLAPRSYVPSLVRAGYDYIVTLNKAAQNLGVQIRLGCRVTALKGPDENHLMTVEAHDDLKRRSTFRTRAVVLATGGYSGNVAMRQKYNDWLGESYTTTADPYRDNQDTATGDGIALGVQLGADLVDMDCIQTLPFWGGRLTDYVGADIYVDDQGHRFVNEASSWKRISEAIRRLPTQSFWVITDAQSLKGASRSAKLMKGIVRTASTLSEMADGMGISPAVLEATITRYNGFVQSGLDGDFGKRMFTQTIAVPPFYYGREHLFVHYCCGGLRFDTDARVLDKNGRPVPGLYAAGEVTGGLHGADRLGGCSITDCMVFGRTAGRNAAQWSRTHHG